MGFTTEVARGFRKVRERLEELTARQRSDTLRITLVERKVSPLVTDPNALALAPGSPLLQIGETFLAHVTARVDETHYTAIRQTLDPSGAWKIKDSVDNAPITIRSVPLFGIGDGNDEFSPLVVDTHVWVTWAGRANDGTDVFYAVQRCFEMRCRVKSVQNDHLVCRFWDGVAEGAVDILVAKPFHLRRSSYDGKSIAYTDLGAADTLSFAYSNGYTRVVTRSSDSTSETEVIVPSYMGSGSGFGGEEITARTAPAGGTGVTVSGAKLAWYDAGSARSWDKQ